MFDSLQQSISGTAASTATIGGAVAAVFIAAAGSIFYDYIWCPSRCRCCCAGRSKAAWSCKAATKVALATQPRGGYFRAAQVGRPRVSCGSGGAALPSDCATS